jgi:hypothetical protein
MESEEKERMELEERGAVKGSFCSTVFAPSHAPPKILDPLFPGILLAPGWI